MSYPATVRIGVEDLSHGLPFTIFRDESNPFELPRYASGPRGRVMLMNRMRMNVTHCEHCGRHQPLVGEKIDPHGPECPDNFIALCQECQVEWKAWQGC